MREVPPRIGERAASPSEPDVRSSGTDEVDDGPETELPVPAGELIGGRYVLERIFAEGGMGIVCLGRHAQLEQTVAIKFLRHALVGKSSVVERFLNEGRALAALRSEHVVRVMDVGQLDSGRPYLVMEHLEGVDLGALVDRDGPLPAETAARYALQVCEPLAEAHGLGIVHRDIKPENLFLWSGGPGRDVVKVLDFGLAKQFGSSRGKNMTGPQDSIGSPCYMSPEQITTPQSIDFRTDVWSLGVVLHHLLTDALPFDGASIVEVLSHVLSAPPKSLHDARPDVAFDPELEAIVARCLEKKADARYQTMTELADALSGYLAQRSSVAIPLPESEARMAIESTPPVYSKSNPAPAFVAQPAPRVFEGDDEKIRIAGVHSRWPAVLLMALGLAAAGLYEADRTGRVHVRDIPARVLNSVRLRDDVLLSPGPEHVVIDTSLARGVYARETTREANGALALRAVREIDNGEATATDDDPAASVPISDEERARRQAVYRDYLTSQGLTPLSEVVQPPEAPPAAE